MVVILLCTCRLWPSHFFSLFIRFPFQFSIISQFHLFILYFLLLLLVSHRHPDDDYYTITVLDDAIFGLIALDYLIDWCVRFMDTIVKDYK